MAIFQDDNESEIINTFNSEYSTQLRIPIVYKPKEDLVIM